MKLFSINTKRNIEFSVVGVANVAEQTVKFQGQLNGVPFTEGADYEKIRSRVMKAVEMNSHQTNKSLS